jgi:hypothetical protein
MEREGIAHAQRLASVPFSFTATNNEKFFCASHPTNCSIQLTAILRTPDRAQELDKCQRGILVLHHECQGVELG